MGSGDDPANILSMEDADKSLPLPTDYPPWGYPFNRTSLTVLTPLYVKTLVQAAKSAAWRAR